MRILHLAGVGLNIRGKDVTSTVQLRTKGPEREHLMERTLERPSHGRALLVQSLWKDTRENLHTSLIKSE